VIDAFSCAGVVSVAIVAVDAFESVYQLDASWLTWYSNSDPGGARIPCVVAVVTGNTVTSVVVNALACTTGTVLFTAAIYASAESGSTHSISDVAGALFTFMTRTWYVGVKEIVKPFVGVVNEFPATGLVADVVKFPVRIPESVIVCVPAIKERNTTLV
jgi:hypothetical protein